MNVAVNKSADAKANEVSDVARSIKFNIELCFMLMAADRNDGAQEAIVRAMEGLSSLIIVSEAP